MIEQIFTALTAAMTGYFGIALLAAYAWGVLSILLSPCHLSSIPLVLGYISLKDNPTHKKVFKLSLAFALGVLVSIAIVGATTSLLGGILGYIGPFGLYLGTPSVSRRSSSSPSLTQAGAFTTEFRLDMFDMVPTGTPGSAFVQTIGK